MNKHLVPFLLSLSLVGCSATTAGPDGTTGSDCTGGKCDAFTPPALQTLDTVFGECTVTPDLETADEFYALDKTDCAFVDFDESISAHINSISIDTVQLATNRYSSARFEQAELDGSSKTIATYNTDGYPVRSNIQPILYIETSSGSIKEPRSSGAYLIPEVTLDTLERPAEPVSSTLEMPLKFQQVVIWPTQELADLWAEGDNSFVLIKIASEVELDGSTRTFSFSRHARGGEDLSPLTKTIFSVPVTEGSLALLETRLDTDHAVDAVSINGPGYFLLEKDGSLTAATPEEVEARGMFDRDDEPPVIIDDNPEPDVPPTDPVDPVDPADDPCNGACDATEACVASSCVPLEDQRQTSCRSTPTAACESDVDCAADNACVEGKCSLRECRTQDSRCYNPTYTCEQDSDCAADHACADGMCRRLSCQTQDSRCYNPTKVCEQTSDCAEGHSCVEGLCRRLECQVQDSRCYNPTKPCAEDTDCGEGHACVAELCRRLTCQVQDSRCYNATKPCETTSDCGEGHVCEEGLCERLTCQR